MPRKTKADLEAEVSELKAKIEKLEFENYIREGRWERYNYPAFSWNGFRPRPMAAFEHIDIRLANGTEICGTTVLLVDWDITGTEDEVVYYRSAPGRNIDLINKSREPGWIAPKPKGNK